MTKPYSVRKSKNSGPWKIDTALDTIRPMTEEERQASKQREEANAKEKEKRWS